MEPDKATLSYDGQDYALPVVTGSDGKPALDLTDLRRKTGLLAFDPSLMNTAVTRSEITWIDSENGKLLYRGYSVEQLVQESSYVEVAYLLTNGELPTPSQYAEYSTTLSKHSLIHEAMRNFFDGFPGTAHPLAILATMVTALSSYYPDTYESHKEQGVDVKARLLAKVRTLAAMAYKKSIGQPIVYPRDELPYCANFLNMMFAIPAEAYTVPADDEKILNQILILYSDHEQNVATSTVRLLGSTRANLFVCINAGISALWGSREASYSLHTIPMLTTMLNNRMSPERFFEKFISGHEPLKSSAFGHRKYKTVDPRARISRELFHAYYRTHAQKRDPLMEIALEVEEFTLGHTYFKELGFYPNLDFYSALIFRLMGIPTNMNNVIRCIGKLAGWLAQWSEQRAETKHRQMRPQQVYSGMMERPFKPVSER
ncbi:MAG: citrate synthase [Spirochaetales bacterium]|nr:citrate synthase [Leptospiraceae bacterium]MCP5480326.1 citrate synthase [Spirochaetales bacterium]